jgi:hypothetical protein
MTALLGQPMACVCRVLLSYGPCCSQQLLSEYCPAWRVTGRAGDVPAAAGGKVIEAPAPDPMSRGIGGRVLVMTGSLPDASLP